MNQEQQLIVAMARTLFVQAFASREEQSGRHIKPGTSWDALAPATPKEAVHEAYRLAGRIEQANQFSLLSILAAARRADGFAEEAPVPKDYVEAFGFCLTMEALGHGISWSDEHAPVVMGLDHRDMVIPDFEYQLEDEPSLSLSH